MQPLLPVKGEFGLAQAGVGAGRIAMRDIDEIWRKTGPGEIPDFLVLIGINDNLYATLRIQRYNSSLFQYESNRHARIF